MSNSQNKRLVYHDPIDKPVRINLKKYSTKGPIEFILAKQLVIPKQKVYYSKKIIYDYVDLVNKRQTVQDMASKSQEDFLKVSQKTQQCFDKYYSPTSIYRQKMEALLNLIRPEKRFVKMIANQNTLKIEQYLHRSRTKDTSPTHDTPKLSQANLRTKKEKLFYLSDPANSETVPTHPQAQQDSDQADGDRFQQQYQRILQQQLEQERRRKNIIQTRLFDSQLKYQGDSFIKQNIFKQNMKQSSKLPSAQQKNRPRLQENYFVSTPHEQRNLHILTYSPKIGSVQQSRQQSLYNTTNSSQEFLPVFETIREDCYDVTDSCKSIDNSIKQQKLKSRKSFCQLIKKQDRQINHFDRIYFKNPLQARSISQE